MLDGFFLHSKKSSLSRKNVKVTLSTLKSFAIDDELLNQIKNIFIIIIAEIGGPKE